MRLLLHGYRSLLLITAFVLLPLFMAACGGGGGSSEAGSIPVLTIGGQILAGVQSAAPSAGPNRLVASYTVVANATLVMAGVTTTSDAQGYYRFDFTRAQADLMIATPQKISIQSTRTGNVETSLRIDSIPISSVATQLIKIRVPLQTEGIASTTPLDLLVMTLPALPPTTGIGAINELVSKELTPLEDGNTNNETSPFGGISGLLSPKDATITLNGLAVSTASTAKPRLILTSASATESLFYLENVSVGQHTVKAARDGYSSAEKSTTVYAGLTRAGVNLSLQAYNQSNDLRLVLVTGDNQEAVPGGVLPSPLVVKVTNQQNVSQANVPVTFASDNGGTVDTDTQASGNQTVAVTDNDGRAICLVARLGSAAGTQTFRATLSSNTTTPLIFHATARSADMPTVHAVTSTTRIADLQLTGTKPTPTTVILINGSDSSVRYPTSTSWAGNLTLNEGNNLIEITARNASGVVSPAVQVTVNLDTTPPVVPVLTNNPSPVSAAQITVNGTKSSDAVSIRVNGSASGVSLTSTTTWSALLNLNAGNNVFQFTALDTLGNESDPGTVTIVRDVTGADGTIALNNGATWTNTQTVTLKLTSLDAAEMRFSLDGTTWTAWEPFATTRNDFDLGSGDGTRTIHAEFRDSLGNTGSKVTVNVTLDTVLPSGTLSILQGATVNSTQVTLVTTSADAAEVRFSLDNVTWSDWETLQAQRPLFSLGIGDGLRTVYAQFRDAATNVSTVVSTTVTVDRSGPGGTIRVETGAPAIATQIVTLNLTSADAAEMRFSLDGVTWSAWEVFATTRSGYDLGAGDGPRAVFVQFRDSLNNVGPTAGTGVQLDTTGPAGTLSISGGAVSTNNLQVTLNITSSDAVEMRFSADGTIWTGWQPLLDTFTGYLLTTGDGIKTVKMELKDTLGNISSVIQDDITLDTSAPTGTVVINADATFTTTNTVALTLNSSDASKMRFSNDATIWSTWETYASTRSNWSLDNTNGEKVVYVQFQDAAGNSGNTAYDRITLDTIGASGSIQLANGSAYTQTDTVTLAISSQDAADMRFSLDNVTFSPWEAYATTKPEFSLGTSNGVKTIYAQFRDSNMIEGSVVTTSVILDTDDPTITLSAPSSMLTNNGTVTFTVTYTGADAVTLSAGDVTINATGTAMATLAVTGNGENSQTVALSNIIGDGTLGITVAANTARDNAGNFAPGATSTAFNVDNTAPGIVIDTPTPVHANVGPVTFVFTYTDCATVTLSSSDVALATTGDADGTITISGTGTTTRTVTVSSITGNGPLTLVVAAGTGKDLANNPTPAITSPILNVDNTKPVVTLTTALTAGGDARINYVEFQTGFVVTAQSSDANGTLFLIPVGTQDDLSSIITAFVAQTGVSAKDTDFTINVTANNPLISVDNSSFYVYAMDAAGNVSPASGVAFTTDFTAPTVTVQPATTAGGDTWVSIAEKTDGFTVTARSSASLGNLYLVADGTAENTGAIIANAVGSAVNAGANLDTAISITANNPGITDGTLYKVYAVDLAGNLSATGGSAFTADLTPPTVTLDGPGTAGSDALINIAEHAAGFSVLAASNDAGGVLHVVDSSTAAVLSAIQNASIGSIASAGAGVNSTIPVSDNRTDVVHGQTFIVYSLDPAGNPSVPTGIAFTVDRVAPTLVVSAPSTIATQTGPVTYTLTYSGATSVSLANGDVSLIRGLTADATLAVSGTGLVTRTITLSPVTGEGSLSITIAANTAQDLAGNPAAGDNGTVFEVDITAPTVSINGSLTAGGTTWINAAEKTNGFNVVAQSNEGSGTLYFVPSTTPQTVADITSAALGSAPVVSAATDAVITIAGGNATITDTSTFVAYTIDAAGNLSAPSSTVLTADLQTPTVNLSYILAHPGYSPNPDHIFAQAGAVTETGLTLTAYLWTDSANPGIVDPGELGSAIVIGQSAADGSAGPSSLGDMTDNTYDFIITVADAAGNTTDKLSFLNKQPVVVNSTTPSTYIANFSPYASVTKGFFYNDLLYATVKSSGFVQVLDRNGNPQITIGTPGTGGLGQLSSPTGVTIANGYIYVADTSSSHRIQRFNMNGNFDMQWGGPGSDDGLLLNPSDLASDSLGNIYVADKSNHRIQKFDMNGNFIANVGSNGTAVGQFIEPSGIAIDSNDLVYVADSGNHRIQVFNSSLGPIDQWGSAGSGNGQFNTPRGICIDNLNNVLVADTSNYRIQKFKTTGEFLTAFGISGSAGPNLKIVFHEGVTTDKFGQIYIMDTGHNLIKKVTP